MQSGQTWRVVMETLIFDAIFKAVLIAFVGGVGILLGYLVVKTAGSFVTYPDRK